MKSVHGMRRHAASRPAAASHRLFAAALLVVLALDPLHAAPTAPADPVDSLSQVASADETCRVLVDDVVFDLTPLASIHNGGLDTMIGDSIQLNPCGPVSNALCPAGSSVCRLDKTDNPNKDIGSFSSRIWVTQQGFPVLSLEGEKIKPDEEQRYKTLILFKCDETAKGQGAMDLVTINGTDPSLLTLIWRTALVCRSGGVLYPPLSTASPEAVTARSGEKAYFTVRLKDGNRQELQNCTGMSPVVAVDIGPVSFEPSFDAATCTARVAVWAAAARLYPVAVRVNGQLIGTAVTLTVTPSEPKMWFFLDLRPLVAGSPYRIRFYAVDAAGNNVTFCVAPGAAGSSQALFTLADGSQPALPIACNSGDYYVEASFTVAGAGSVRMVVNGTEVLQSALEVQPSSFVAPSCSLLFEQNDPSSVIAGQPWATLVMCTQDRFGNKEAGCYPQHGITAAVAGPTAVTTVSQCATRGLVEISFTATRAGLYTVSVNASGEAIPNGPVDVVVLPASPEATEAELRDKCPLEFRVAGMQCVAYVQMKDKFGNPSAACEDTGLKLVINGLDDNSTATYTYNQCLDGAYAFPYNITKAGRFTLGSYSTTSGVSSNAVAVTVVSAAFTPTQSYLLRDVPVRMTAGVSDTIRVQAADQFGNAKSDCTGVDFVISLTDMKGRISTISNNTFCADGVSSAPVALTKSGRYSLSVTSLSTSFPIKESPMALIVAPGPLDPENCIVFGEGVTDGGTAHANVQFSIQARDAYGNYMESCDQSALFTAHVAMKGVADGLASGGSDVSSPFADYNVGRTAAAKILGTVTSCRSGVYNITYVPPEPGEYLIEVRYANVSITAEPFGVVTKPPLPDSSSRRESEVIFLICIIWVAGLLVLAGACFLDWRRKRGLGSMGSEGPDLERGGSAASDAASPEESRGGRLLKEGAPRSDAPAPPPPPPPGPPPRGPPGGSGTPPSSSPAPSPAVQSPETGSRPPAPPSGATSRPATPPPAVELKEFGPASARDPDDPPASP